MSQTNSLPAINETSPSSFDDNVEENNVIANTEILLSISPNPLSSSNDDWKSIEDNNDIQDDLEVINNNLQEQNNDDGWANFDTFENKTNQNSETVPVTASDIDEDDWAGFESNITPSTQLSDDKLNRDEDIFGDYREVEVSASINTFSTAQIDSLISTCFPLESSTLSTDTDNSISTELPSFTTFNDEKLNQFSCFKRSLSLWNILSNISNDPIGIKYQWRKSNTERLFHHSLGVQERFRTKTVPLIPDDTPKQISVTAHENKILSQSTNPHFDWKRSGLENPLVDIDSPSLSSNFNKGEDNGLDINKTLDLDYYIPPIKSPSLNREEQISSPTVVHRNKSPNVQQRLKPIKTIDLFPGSTTVLNDDNKPVIDSVPNFSSMNAEALMFPIQLNGESTNLY